MDSTQRFTNRSDSTRGHDSVDARLGSTDGTRRPEHGPCGHEARRVAGIDVTACVDCGHVAYADQRGPVSPTAALARLYGEYDLVSTLPALHAPGAEVLLYRPPTRTKRKHLLAFAPHAWFEVDDRLWLAHDDEHLLLATARPVDITLTGA